MNRIPKELETNQPTTPEATTPKLTRREALVAALTVSAASACWFETGLNGPARAQAAATSATMSENATIIDMHRHWITRDWFSDYFWQNHARVIYQFVARMGLPYTIETIQTELLPMLFDTDGEKHLERMDEAGIEKAVVFVIDVGLLVGEPKIAVEQQNEAVFASAKKYPDRIIPFVNIDPRRPSAIKFVKSAIEDWGAKGLKLHPGAGFNPEEKETLKLIESIADYQIPVMVHTGHSIFPTSSRYCDPIYLDNMLLTFPEVNFIAAHVVNGYQEQLLSFGRQRPNLFTDISISQDIARTDYPRFARIIRQAVDSFGPERVLFGTDAPFTWQSLPEIDFVTAITNLTTMAPDDAKLTESEVEMILGTNAKKLLNI
jgi:predicted TIM-barrel fold metal-dependent hydrolase